jgi:hypothetical protein
MKSNYNHRQTKVRLMQNVSKNILKLSLLLGLSVPLTGFTQESHNFSADMDKLETKAGKSRDLYVEADFDFQTFQSVTLDFLVLDAQQLPLDGALLSISLVPDDVVDASDQRLQKKSLLAFVRTDEFGRIYQPLELSNSVKKVLIELDIMRPDNKLIIDVTDTQHITHLFTSE